MPNQNSRRTFLRSAGLLAGGTALASIAPIARAQNDPQPDPNENCAPPGSGSLPAPTPFQPNNSLPLRTRKSAWDLTSSEVTRLNAAYQKLRTLPPEDPRSWLAQAHVHCYNCSGSTDYPSNVEIHGGWWFMPWHRAYLYFHERILASLVGDDTFALPYWDWDNTSRQTFPQVYSVSGQATFDSNREATPTSTPSLGDIFTEYGIDIPTILQDSDYELFMGNGIYPSGTAGNVENGPHGITHLWTAQPSLQDMSGIIDMGVLQTAGRDPVFFCHHGNIDRLWWSWTGAGNANPSDTSWLGQTFNFYDENKVWTSIRISDVIDAQSSLHYEYATSAIPPAAMATAPKRTILASAAEGTTTQGPDPMTKEIPLPQELRTQVPKTRTVKRRYILHIDGIDVPSDRSAIIRVFVNLPTATARTSAKSPNYVGFFTIVAHTIDPTTHAHGNHKINQAFDVTRHLASVLKGASKLQVTLVPVAGLHDRPADLRLAYDKVYLTEK
jgi:polyphenol oxidase